ncbi:MAG: FG-GAP-like repeat-containing protein, partial [Rhodothermales bacterium]
MGIATRWVTIVVVLGSSVQVYAQEFQQIAANGVSQFGQFGATLRMDDNTLIVGSLWDDQRGSNAGAAFVFSRAPGELWAQEAKLTAGDASQSANFGSAVDVSGNFAVIGASGVNGRTGAAYVFERVNGNWVQRSKMLPSGNEARSVFGASVAINGDWAVIGAPDHFRNSGPGRTGAVYVYQRNGSSWGLQAKIYANDGQSVNYFGSSVDILDNRIVVGATGINSLGGSVYVFRRDGSRWVQEQKITPGDERPGDAFGWAVSLSGIRLAIGSPNDDVASINQGAVRIYRRSGNNWSLEATVTSAGHQTSEHFGFSVHLNDPELLIGAPGDAGGQGSAYFFDRDAAGRWRQQVKYVPPISDRRAAFGRAVGLGGQDILIGASSADGGAVRSGTVFSLGGGGAFRQGFQDTELKLPGLSNPRIEWADADGDGDLDLVLSGNSNGSPQIHLYRNDGDKGFKAQSTGLRNPKDGALSWADLNNDGAMDLIASGDFDGVLETRFYVNDGSGSFTESDSTT